MLYRPPEGDDERLIAIENWFTTRRLTIDFFKKGWYRPEIWGEQKSIALFDRERCKYSVWSNDGSQRDIFKQTGVGAEKEPISTWRNTGTRCEGMRHRDGQRHGIVREIKHNGNISEATYRYDKLHGICVYYRVDGILIVSLHTYGKPLGEMRYDQDLNLISKPV